MNPRPAEAPSTSILVLLCNGAAVRGATGCRAAFGLVGVVVPL